MRNGRLVGRVNNAGSGTAIAIKTPPIVVNVGEPTKGAATSTVMAMIHPKEEYLSITAAGLQSGRRCCSTLSRARIMPGTNR